MIKFTMTTQKLIKKMIAYQVWPDIFLEKVTKTVAKPKKPKYQHKAQLDSSKHLSHTTFKT
jgi:hypothetical protein